MKYYKEQLDKQTFKDFEFICANDSGEDGGFIPRQKDGGDCWNLNKAYNDAIKQAKGELLVFIQDFIWIPANSLQRFWDVYSIYGKILVTGCGHKYEKDLKTIDEFDDRTIGKKRVEEVNFTQWELNYSSCPRDYMPEFDEEMDKQFGGENAYISYKAKLPVYLDRLNECKGLSQEICGGRPENWEKFHINKTNKIQQWIKTY
jgi:hypothetical protein